MKLLTEITVVLNAASGAASAERVAVLTKACERAGLHGIVVQSPPEDMLDTAGLAAADGRTLVTSALMSAAPR